MGVFRYFHTLRYLKPIQIYGRVWFFLNRPRPDLRLAPAPPLRIRTGTWCLPCSRPSSMYAPAGFFFLNESHELKSAADWNNPEWEKLWLYNLHYFDDLNAKDAAGRKSLHKTLIERWIAENPPPHGVGWESYPLSLRIVNWIKWALCVGEFEAAWLDSLAIQARYLRRRLEYHLLGNHLLANAKALVFAGLYFQGDEADEWLAKGLKILAREVSEQVHSDGGHFELSPMYHSIILEDLLDLINLCRAYEFRGDGERIRSAKLFEYHVPVWIETVNRMRYWLQALCHPDGQIAFFNDTALRIAPSPDELETYAQHLGLGAVSSVVTPVCVMSDSGYVRLEQGHAAVWLDAGQIGPDYLPGHAHADTLTFELSVDGQRIIVNSGTSCYGGSEERLGQRSTAAHNTVVINDENSSEVWGGFRVARRAYPEGLKIRKQSESVQVSCAHNGYRRLAGRPIHRRDWRLTKSSLIVTDTIEGRYRSAVGRIHLHPDVHASTTGSGEQGEILLLSGKKIAWQLSNAKGRLVPSTYHPEFGKGIQNQCLEYLFSDSKASIIFNWD